MEQWLRLTKQSEKDLPHGPTPLRLPHGPTQWTLLPVHVWKTTLPTQCLYTDCIIQVLRAYSPHTARSCSFLGSVHASVFDCGCSPVSVSSKVCLAVPAHWHCMSRSLLVYSLEHVLSMPKLAQCLCVCTGHVLAAALVLFLAV